MVLPYGRTDQDTTPILRGDSLFRDNETLLQDAGRTGDLVAYTLMARNPATNKLVPLTDNTATDGTEIPAGLSVHTVTEAAIQAGDITGYQLYIKCEIDEASIVLENSLTLETELTNQNQTIRDMLVKMGIIPIPGVDIDRPENT